MLRAMCILINAALYYLTITQFSALDVLIAVVTLLLSPNKKPKRETDQILLFGLCYYQICLNMYICVSR